MAKFIAIKQLGALRPADEAGAEVLRKLANGELLTVEIKRPRSIKHHRMFWALMTVVWNQMDRDKYPTVEDLAGAIKILVGLRTRVELPDGLIGFIPGSISFHKMDQTGFDDFYNRVCDLIAEKFLPGVTSDELRHEVSLMIGTSTGAQAA